MFRHWLNLIMVWSDLDAEQLRAIAAIVGICSGATAVLAFILGRALAWKRAYADVREFKKGLDGDNVVIERLITTQIGPNEIRFDTETAHGSHNLRDVLGNDAFFGRAQAALKKRRIDGRIFLPGPDHRLMMQRVRRYITGNSESASMSAMFGRREEFHVDEVAFAVRHMEGTDGFEMFHILVANPKFLRSIANDPSVMGGITFQKGSLKRRFGEFLLTLAADHAASEKELKAVTDEASEKVAQQKATFWPALIRTPKLSLVVSTEQ